jgi:hypothetical protein
MVATVLLKRRGRPRRARACLELNFGKPSSDIFGEVKFCDDQISAVMQRFITTISFAICLLVGGCFDANHPDTSRYEYLYMNGHFQPPYNTFPQGLARGSWTCFDEKTQTSFDCTMVRGGWEHFQYIYRARKAA